MARSLDPETKKVVASRIRYYRDMGIYDFYRRGSGAVEGDVPAVMDTEYTEETITTPKRKTEAQVQTDDPITALHQIREDLGDCTRCRLHKQGRKQIVFGVGNPHAELMFVGEGPGADEDEQGEPFVGRAGQLLNKMIEAMGLKREQVYIANVVKCRPPGNRTPEKDECDTCSPFLLRQIEVTRPKAVVALGAVAAKTLLGVADSMNNLRQRSYDFRGTTLFVTYHPAYLLRDPRQKAETWKDLQKVMAFLGLELPRKD
jgi:uracil-DNA glycosylase